MTGPEPCLPVGYVFLFFFQQRKAIRHIRHALNKALQIKGFPMTDTMTDRFSIRHKRHVDPTCPPIHPTR